MQVLRAFSEKGNARNLIALDLDRCESLSEDCLYKFLLKHGTQLRGLVLSGIPHVTDQLWAGTLPSLMQTKILVMGMPEGCCPKIHQKVSIAIFFQIGLQIQESTHNENSTLKKDDWKKSIV